MGWHGCSRCASPALNKTSRSSLSAPVLLPLPLRPLQLPSPSDLEASSVLSYLLPSLQPFFLQATYRLGAEPGDTSSYNPPSSLNCSCCCFGLTPDPSIASVSSARLPSLVCQPLLWREPPAASVHNIPSRKSATILPVGSRLSAHRKSRHCSPCFGLSAAYP